MMIDLTESEIADVTEALNSRAANAYSLADENELLGRLDVRDGLIALGDRRSRLISKILSVKNPVQVAQLEEAATTYFAELDQEDAIAFDAQVAEINNDPEAV